MIQAPCCTPPGHFSARFGLDHITSDQIDVHPVETYIMRLKGLKRRAVYILNSDQTLSPFRACSVLTPFHKGWRVIELEVQLKPSPTGNGGTKLGLRVLPPE